MESQGGPRQPWVLLPWLSPGSPWPSPGAQLPQVPLELHRTILSYSLTACWRQAELDQKIWLCYRSGGLREKTKVCSVFFFGRPRAPREVQEGQGDPGESQGRGTHGCSLGAPWPHGFPLGPPGHPWVPLASKKTQKIVFFEVEGRCLVLSYPEGPKRRHTFRKFVKDRMGESATLPKLLSESALSPGALGNGEALRASNIINNVPREVKRRIVGKGGRPQDKVFQQSFGEHEEKPREVWPENPRDSKHSGGSQAPPGHSWLPLAPSSSLSQARQG